MSEKFKLIPCILPFSNSHLLLKVKEMKTMVLVLIYISPWLLPQPESKVVAVAKELVGICVSM